jgi:hypothetical protein
MTFDGFLDSLVAHPIRTITVTVSSMAREYPGSMDHSTLLMLETSQGTLKFKQNDDGWTCLLTTGEEVPTTDSHTQDLPTAR